MKPSRLRIAVLTSHPIQYQAPLYRELASRDIELKVFFCWDFGVRQTFDPGFGRAVEWDVPLVEGYEHEFLPNVSPRPGTQPLTGLVNPTAPGRIYDWRPDVVVVHGYTHLTTLAVIQAAYWHRVPVLMRGESNLLVARPPWVRAVKRYGVAPLLRSLAGALAIGTLNREFYRYCGVPEERIFLAPYTVDNAFFRRDAERSRQKAAALRQRFGIGDGEQVVLFAAKLIPVKGCADLIRAYAARRRENTTLVIAGEGPLRQQLERLAASYPDRSIRFVGFMNQSEMPALYALGDVFIIPSNREPWGLAVNEAMNLARPIIASDQVGCAPDLVSSENGWVFPAGDVRALDRALTEALSDRDTLVRKGNASLDRIEHWDIRHTADGYIEGTRAVALS